MEGMRPLTQNFRKQHWGIGRCRPSRQAPDFPIG
jgi:hypothetical protein